MQWSYAQSGIEIPRVTDTQIAAENATAVPERGDLRPGDLVFFSDGGPPHHVGMYIGGDKFLHAPSTGDVVKVSSLGEDYFSSQFIGGRRFDEAPSAAAFAAAPQAPAPQVPVPPGVDPTAVAKAQAAVARDAAEVRRNESGLFMAVTAEQARKEKARHHSAMFLKAIDPSQVKRPTEPQAAASSVPTPPSPPPEVQTPAPPSGSVSASIDLAAAAAEYPGNDASQAELAKWLADQAEKAGLPRELPVMAALVESKVQNLNYGHADSVGFFQMRTSYWNQGEYAGYPDRPELQAKWFIDTALEVKRNAIAAGDADFGRDPAKWGEWIADTEKPAEEYRYRYQEQLDAARRLLAA
jgi:hypothetical protein